MTETADRVASDDWYPVAALAEVAGGGARRTVLLGAELELSGAGAGCEVRRHGETARLPVLLRFGYVWTTLGTPATDLFAIPEAGEPDRRNLSAGTFAVRASALRLVENFLDMGHFAMVHTGYLGIEPHTEIKPYRVAVTPDRCQIIATGCKAYQPLASLMATEGFEVDYTYRVPHPYCAVLYKSSALDRDRLDVIALFCRPVSEEGSVAYLFLSMLDDRNSDQALQVWQQIIFGQDKPILENQIPARLPLKRGAEIPVPADATSTAYRRWLVERGVRYGALV